MAELSRAGTEGISCGMCEIVEELIPEMPEGKRSNVRMVLFDVGFTVVMALDVALG